MKFFSQTLNLIKESAKGWYDHDAMVWSAAQAYFTIFAIGPIFLIIISVLGPFLGDSEVENKILSLIRAYIGNKGGQMVKTIIDEQKMPSANFFSMLFGGIALLVSAPFAFGLLQAMLNCIWGVKIKKRKVLFAILWQRSMTFIMLFIIALLFIVSTFASTTISSLAEVIQKEVSIPMQVISFANFIITLLVITLLLCIIFKMLPDVKIKWSNVFLGAIITAILLCAGKSLISLFISNITATGYGAAASFAVLLLFFYFSALIFFFGAEFTRAYTLKKEGRITPAPYAQIKKND